MESHIDSYIVHLCHLFPALSPWNVYDLRVRHYLAFCAAVDAYRAEGKEVRRG